MQNHYVGLDKIPEQPQPTVAIPVQPAQPETIANSDAEAEQPESVSDNELDDATIEQEMNIEGKSVVPHKLA